MGGNRSADHRASGIDCLNVSGNYDYRIHYNALRQKRDLELDLLPGYGRNVWPLLRSKALRYRAQSVSAGLELKYPIASAGIRYSRPLRVRSFENGGDRRARNDGAILVYDSTTNDDVVEILRRSRIGIAETKDEQEGVLKTETNREL